MLALAIEFTGVPGARILRYSGRSRTAGDAVSVAIAEGRHPVPFRTRKLSLPAPMVLPWRRGGRVGRRRDILDESRLRAALVVSRHCSRTCRCLKAISRNF